MVVILGSGLFLSRLLREIIFLLVLIMTLRRPSIATTLVQTGLRAFFE